MGLLDGAISDQLLAADFVEQHDIIQVLREKPYSVKDIDPSIKYSHISYWAEKGLISSEYMKWRKFSFEDAIWVVIIRKLREFGLSVSALKKLKEQLYQSVDLTQFYDQKELIALFEEELKGPAYDEIKDVHMQAIIKNLHTDEGLQASIAGLSFSVLTNLLIDLITQRRSSNLWIDAEGNALVYIPEIHEHLLADPEYQSFQERSYISLSLDAIVGLRVAADMAGKLYQSSWQLVSETERIVLETLRNENVSAVTITMPEGKPKLMKVSSREKIKRAQEVAGIMLKGGYQTISLKTENGVIVSCENTVNTKL
jgi:DNA-binding transcriptional MerR regulator